MLRKIVVFIKYLGRRRSKCFLPLLLWAVLSLITFFWLGEEISRALAPPAPPDQNLQHFRRSSDLKHYLDNIQLLIEPSSVPCSDDGAMPVLILVTSAPSHLEHRQAIRNTWGKHQSTYFLLGVNGQGVKENDKLADNYVEAKEYSDMIIYDLPDHYQNLTLKTVLMLQWTLERCPQAKFLFKTDDDVLINPWMLEQVVKENDGAKLLGYRKEKRKVHRDEYTKWYVPRWLCSNDYIPQYLSGTGYLISGDSLQKIFTTAKTTPLINLEDVYLTFIVSKSKLNLSLVHDYRLSPYKPWLFLDCAYWTLASSHSYKPNEIVHAWAKIERLSKRFTKGEDVCTSYKNYIDSELFLY